MAHLEHRSGNHRVMQRRAALLKLMFVLKKLAVNGDARNARHNDFGMRLRAGVVDYNSV